MVLTHGSAIPQSLYLHYPVCRHQCSYCDFNVYPIAKLQNKAEFDRVWTDKILEHLTAFFRREAWSEKSSLKTIYIGGGTPSLFDRKELARLIESLNQKFHFESDLEFSLEANPEDISAVALTEWKALGVNRLSVGVQSFQSSELRRLERLATATSLRTQLEQMAKVFSNFSLDLMFGIPDQKFESLVDNLDKLTELSPPHLSVYLLTIQADHKWNRSGKISSLLPQEGAIEAMYNEICKRLSSASYIHYEVSNFAKAGFESKHNRSYWKIDRAYLGLGPGAHGYFPSKSMRYENYRGFQDWLDSETGIGSEEFLSDAQQKLERLYLDLRSGAAVSLEHCDRSQASLMSSEGLCRIDERGLQMTEKGWLLLDAVASRLLHRL